MLATPSRFRNCAYLIQHSASAEALNILASRIDDRADHVEEQTDT